MPAGDLLARLKLDRSAAPPTSPPAATSTTTSPPRGPRASPLRRPGRTITGRLQEHGRANYQFEPDARPSYYVKILTQRGLETLWGVDLERAISKSQSQPQIGSLVGIRRTGFDVVTLPPDAAAPNGQRTFRRIRWLVETVTFLAEADQRARRARELQLGDQAALRAHPELKSAFVSLHVAQKYAARRIPNAEDRELFLKRLREVMAASIRNGVPVPEPRLRSPPAPLRATSAPVPRAKEREEPTR